MSSFPATVLVVDDEASNRKLLETLLQPQGYLTVSADSGAAALAAIERRAPDLILLDYRMPGMDGLEVARSIKADPRTSSIPIIMVTAQTDREARLASLDAGAEEFLGKPVDRAELWLRVRNLLRLKTFADFLQNHSAVLEREVQERTAALQFFRAAMDATADAIMLVSRTTMRFVEINSTASTMLGYTREELLQMGPVELGEGTAEGLAAEYDAIIEGREAAEAAEVNLRCKNGSAFVVEAHRHAGLYGADWVIVGVLRDVTERKEAEKRLQKMAHFDALTGLPNRTLFHQTLCRTLAQAPQSDSLVAVMCIDLDNFKNINDMLGHAIGDELLRQFGNRLLTCVRIRDTVGRLGGDEFAVILMMPGGQAGAAHVAEKIREALRAPFDLKGHKVFITASIGITVHPDDSSDPDDLLKFADTAMYRGKQSGRNTYCYFTPQMNAEMLARLALETALLRAVENNEFVLYYQPVVGLHSGHITGLEALLRWQRPGYGRVLPRDFISVLEETGLIVRVGSWVIATVCRQIAAWNKGTVGPMRVSVNVSGRQFVDGDLEGDVVKALVDNDVAPHLLEVELTESSLMANTQRTITILENLRARGVRISVDDFGTGYSSLAYLRRFPIDKLKIDIGFIREVTSNPEDSAIVLAIIRMAHSLKLDVVAEGVETAAQLAYLRRNQCDYLQGYYFEAPLPLAELESLLDSGRGLAESAGAAVEPGNTLLVVDEDPQVLRDLQVTLRQDGYRILTAPSAAAGLELLALHDVQVVVCDQPQSAADGIAFLQLVQELYPATLRIVLSGHSDPHSIITAINRGSIYRYVLKPWKNAALREDLRDAFRHYWLLHDIQAGQHVDAPSTAMITRQPHPPRSNGKHELAVDPQTLGSLAPDAETAQPVNARNAS